MRTAAAPAKLQPFLDLAERQGLQVRESDDADGLGSLLVRAWRIGSDPAAGYVSHLIFAYWTDGARGGRRSFYLYTTHSHRSKKITGRAARSWLFALGTPPTQREASS